MFAHIVSFCFLNWYKISAKTKNKRLFNDVWLSDSRFSEWLKRIHNKWQACFSFYQKSFDISNMGVTSLTSHASGKKHLEIQISRSSNVGLAFFGKSNTGKAQTNDKDPASKESHTSRRTVGSILIPVSTL